MTSDSSKRDEAMARYLAEVDQRAAKKRSPAPKPTPVSKVRPAPKPKPASPAQPQIVYVSNGPTFGTIVGAIVIAVVILALGAWIIHSVVTANDPLECAIENVERAQDGRPTLDCPE